MTETALERLQRLRDDPRYYCEALLKIRTKDRQLVPFRYNAAQVLLQQRLDALRAQGRPVRLIILKARQMGVSTWFQAQLFHAVATRPYTRAVVIAHDLDSAHNLYSMSRLFYEELPAPLRPMRKYSNRRALVFDNPKGRPPGLRSSIEIATAQDADAGRSSTIHFLHASEVAFWPRPEETMLSLLQAVPHHPDTAVVIESTANGVGGWFYDAWQRAKRGESDFVPVFLPWHVYPDYRMPAPPDMRLTQEEQALKRRFGLDNGQLAWRRWCIDNNCYGDTDRFKQEYPSDDQEAFLVSGRPFFDAGAVRARLDAPDRPEPDTGFLVMENSRVRFVPDRNGFLRVWHHPKPGERYAVGADVAEGLAHGDYSAAQVLDSHMRQAAQWHGHADPDEFGRQLYLLGRYYNDALIGCEVNNHGLTALTTLRSKGYTRLYRRQTWDRLERRFTESIGWQTNAKTRPLMLDFLAACLRDGLLTAYDERFLSEALTFVRKPSGRAEAQAGATDDLVIAMAIALQMHQLLPPAEAARPETDIASRLRRHIESVAKRNSAADRYLGSA